MMKTLDFVEQMYGDHLTLNNLDKFRGAKLGKNCNERGKGLKKFVTQITINNHQEMKGEIKVIKEKSDLKEIQ